MTVAPVPDAHAVNEHLAKDHTGSRISAPGILGRLRDGRYYPELRGACGDLLGHLEEMAQGFYAGDIRAVDKFLQLYSLDAHRGEMKVPSHGAPGPSPGVSGANTTQVGGDHYRRLGEIQPWDVFATHEEIDPFVASAMKYIVRHRHKDGAKDLDKAMHWMLKQQEVTLERPPVDKLGSVLDVWGLNAAEKLLFLTLLCWAGTKRPEHLEDAMEQCARLRRDCYGDPA